MQRFTTSAVLSTVIFAASASMVAPVAAQDSEANSTIAACLEAFGDHPFGSNPTFRTLPVAVRVFGIGKKTVDKEITSSPALVYIKQGINIAGGTVVDLRNPQGWYCMRSAVNVAGGFTIKLACDAQFAVLGQGASVLSGSDGENGTTVMGSTTVRRDC